MNTIKVGSYRINLNLVHEVEEWGTGGITIRYFNDNTDLDGDAARLFLMAWDGEDGEAFDALYEAVNGTPAPGQNSSESEYDRGYHDGTEAVRRAIES